jgi:hypothetical protein
MGERFLYESQWVRLTKVDIDPPHGRRFEHHVVHFQRGVPAVVLGEDDHVLMMWPPLFHG